jgi:protocatechuate 3,4-dioxygenase beta subunit
MICRFDLSVTEPDWALGYQWDIVLRGRGATVFEHPENHR